MATDGSVVVGLCTASPVDQLICENVELQEELDRRLEEVQRLLELEGGQTALLQEQLNKRSNEVRTQAVPTRAHTSTSQVQGRYCVGNRGKACAFGPDAARASGWVDGLLVR